METREALKLIGCVILCELAGAIGAMFTASSITGWYSGLAKPALTPPNWVFGPAWTLLYALMGISFYLVYSSKSKEKKGAMIFFGAQLALNVLWSIAFFGLHSPLYGLLVIVPMWILIAATIWKFNPISRNAALLLIPYILWTTFAAYLNYSVFALN
ncbi:MAG: TspO/MBR family protein [Candidatus Micrarchaeia archaeon]